MARILRERKIVVATHNPGKLVEIQKMLEPFGKIVVSAGELNLPEPDETGETFQENAELKAKAAARAADIPALADDSGLSIEALNGAPGIYSARWGGANKDFDMAMERVENELQESGTENRGAKFVCALSIAWPDGEIETFSGECPGTIVWPPQGDGGFGYDPIFAPDGETRTFGEMTPVEKKQYSHRANAFDLMIQACLVR